MKFEHTEVFNFEGAFRGLRNPLESWNKSDSYTCDSLHCSKCPYLHEDGMYCNVEDGYIIGPNDLDLAHRMIKAGSSDSKFLRQILVSVDITAPLYLWKEIDTYKIGTTANSTSTMHKIASTPITIDCFEINDLDDTLDMDDSWYHIKDYITDTIVSLEALRQKYNETKDQRYWKELIRWLPEGWLQTRTWTANYAILRNIYFQRKSHRLSEWHQFCKWIEQLPYSKELILYGKD